MIGAAHRCKQCTDTDPVWQDRHHDLLKLIPHRSPSLKEEMNMKRDKLITFVDTYLANKNIGGGLIPTSGGGVQIIYSIGTPKEYTDKIANEAIKAFNDLGDTKK